MPNVVLWFLSAEVAAFAAAALVHSGVVAATGYEHWEAATAETVIGVVLLAGLVAATIAPHASRRIALGVQGFALLGTMVGIFTIAIGIGPQSAGDLVFHAGLIALLVTGLVMVARSRVGTLQRG